MMNHEPGRSEMFLTRLAFLLYGRSVYKAFADRLPLTGSERVLDFGCGMGTVAYYAVKRLTRGNLTCLDISGRWLKACRKTMRGCENVSFMHTRENTPALPQDCFDIIYSHFVLHDISESGLSAVIPALTKALKPGGTLVFREPLNESNKLNIIRRLMDQNILTLLDSRVTDVPLMGNALESVYVKQ
jgi:ubiquinone/menaquinone biosynthesis C-methylase UbiE